MVIDCVLVGFKNQFSTRKGTYEDKQGALWQVKIGKERVDHAKPVAGLYRQIHFARARRHQVIVSC